MVFVKNDLTLRQGFLQMPTADHQNFIIVVSAMSLFLAALRKCFYQSLCDLQLSVPSTFHECVNSGASAGTYFWSADAQPVPIDYSILSNCVHCLNGSVSNQYIDINKNAIDHIALTATIYFAATMKLRHHLQSHRKPQ